MDFRHLECFFVLAQELHFGRAAERLHVGQSSVSESIRALEKTVGAPLFDRTSRRVALTPLGQALREGAEAAYMSLKTTLAEQVASDALPDGIQLDRVAVADQHGGEDQQPPGDHPRCLSDR